jgi:hypothetical protein
MELDMRVKQNVALGCVLQDSHMFTLSETALLYKKTKANPELDGSIHDNEKLTPQRID